MDGCLSDVSWSVFLWLIIYGRFCLSHLARDIDDIVKNYHINFKSAGGSASTGNSRPPSPVQSKPGAGPNPSQLITKFTKVP